VGAVTILHLVGATEWEAGAGEELYVAPSLAAEGFIHCTGDAGALLAVANALYRDQPGDLLVLEIDERRLTSEVRWESAMPAPPPGVSPDVRFPHVYGPIERGAVDRVARLARATDGTYLGDTSTTRGSSPSALRTPPG
jgi:uncharacterized protein (DUF952 family)